jgi:hypothetical protein
MCVWFARDDALNEAEFESLDTFDAESRCAHEGEGTPRETCPQRMASSGHHEGEVSGHM